MSHSYEVITRLKAGRTLTAIEALREFGCFRLAARVCDLRDAGWKIETREIKKGGKRYAEYYIDQSNNNGEVK